MRGIQFFSQLVQINSPPHSLALEEFEGRVAVAEEVGPPHVPALLVRQPLAREHLQEGQEAGAVAEALGQVVDLQWGDALRKGIFGSKRLKKTIKEI